jgi:peptidoglycan/LPS O-acetylase OafA/YrhL
VQSKRNFGLDLLRAAAITGVFLGHAIGAVSRLTIGLDLFFVLSGFLIGRIYFRSRRDGSFHLWRFWLSRWWRTLPPYYAALALYALVGLWHPNKPVDWRYLFFLQNFTYRGTTAFAQSWSLCVEEHFYLMLPLLGFAAERLFGRRHLLWLLPVAFAVPSLLIYWTIHRMGGIANVPTPWFWLWRTQFSSQGLIAGVWMAYLYVEKPGWFKSAKRPSLLLAVVLLPIFFYLTGQNGGVWLASTNAGFKAIGCAALLRVTYDLSWEPHTWIGRSVAYGVRWTALASYSIYLVHTLFNTAALDYVGAWPRGAAKTGIILILMALPCLPFYYLVERPSIASRDRYLKRIAISQTESPVSQ